MTGPRLLTSAATAGVALTAAGVGAGSEVFRAMGAPKDLVLSHINHSPHQTGGNFGNVEPPTPVEGDRAAALAMLRRGDIGKPRRPLEFDVTPLPDVAAELAATWMGHASVLVELDGYRILTDPVWSKRCSPSSLVGPARMHPVPHALADLPALDVVLISHDHYDHLDTATVRKLAATHPEAAFVAPIGVGAHLEYWGISPERIHEADWGDSITIGELTFNCTPARHFSGRGLQRNTTQWASWAVAGPRHNFFFSGDTGITDAFEQVGTDHGPFGLSLIAIGAYDRLWPDIHLNPEEAVRVHRMLNSANLSESLLLPIHWGTFNLALHEWADPVQRLLPAAQAEQIPVITPMPGARFDVPSRSGHGFDTQSWWEGAA
ncbi:MBL fold metallo-hydrolase [Williamsia muralis]|uniref:MBL fold metallo-hydrolase n=1 Tax=Williamsia marianensis TaxID=85044 RepID=A0A2G3PTC6_WILMA|nr:MBL fold metallo-hydrolase [Williamsia marianensis]PHV68983.1 MBL fold metallo-hydrolase [Williamsia marianensis]